MKKMTMADRYCETAIKLDNRFSNAKWNYVPLSEHQQDVYINAEERQRKKILGKYPYEYIATVKDITDTGITIYNIEQVFADGSKLPCSPMLMFDRDIQALIAEGEKVTINM